MNKINTKDLKVIFAGCAKNCEKFLLKNLENLKLYSSLFKESYKIIVENGSADKTKKILQQNKGKNDFFLYKEELNQLNFRGHRLEKARNCIIETIKKNNILNQCDLLIILDFDDSGAYTIKLEEIVKAINYLYSKINIAAVFANQEGTYYDMWTLRHKDYCPNDFWVDVVKYITKRIKLVDKIKPELFKEVSKNIIEKKTYTFDKKMPPIKVESAFGGFGIYKLNYALNNKRQYQGSQYIDLEFKTGEKKRIKYQKCEHVNFNQGLVDQDLELYILPNLINRDNEIRVFSPKTVFSFLLANLTKRMN